MDTIDFGNYFAFTYSSRIEKWAFFNQKHVGINTNTYLEALHKHIKYCYLEGKLCRRLDLSVNALMLLVIWSSHRNYRIDEIKIDTDKK